MNIHIDITEAVKAIPIKVWDDFFDDLRQKEYHNVEHTEEPLTDLRSRVKMISEINGMFRSIHSQESTQA